MKTLLLVGCAAAVALVRPHASAATEPHDLAALLSRDGLTTHHRSLHPAHNANYAGVVHWFDVRAGGGFAWISLRGGNGADRTFANLRSTAPRGRVS